MFYWSQAMNLSEGHQSEDGEALRDAGDEEEISHTGERVYVYEEACLSEGRRLLTPHTHPDNLTKVKDLGHLGLLGMPMECEDRTKASLPPHCLP